MCRPDSCSTPTARSRAYRASNLAVTAGVAFVQQPVVQVQDQFGNVRSTNNGTADNTTVVTATRGAGSGALQGVTNRTAVNGVVTYTNLSHNVATNITVLLSSGSL